MRVGPPQSQTEWQGVPCLAGPADVILGPEGIGLVGVPAPTRTHGVGQRGLPGHRGAGLGLVGFEGKRRNLEQEVGGAATAVAKEGGGGTAAVQACKKGERRGETQAHLGLLYAKHRLIPEIPAVFLQLSLEKQVGLGKTGPISSLPRVWPSRRKAQGGPRREGAQTPGEVASRLPLLYQTYHILDFMSELFLGSDPDFQPLLGERRGRHIPTLPLALPHLLQPPVLPGSIPLGCQLPLSILLGGGAWISQSGSCLAPSP